MNEGEQTDYRPATSAAGRWVEGVVRLLALFGGVLLALLAIMQVVSVAARAVLGKPISGDFELIQIGAAVVVFAFLPMAHLHRHNFAVTLFTERLSRRVRSAMTLIGSAAMLVIAAVIAWRMCIGGGDLARSGEHTMVLQFKLWWAFVPILFSLAVLVAAAVVAFASDLAEARR